MTEPAKIQSLNPELISLLRCPVTLSPVRLEGDWLVGEVGGLRYPVRDGIPVMLVEEARIPPPFKTMDEFKARFRDSIRRT